MKITFILQPTADREPTGEARVDTIGHVEASRAELDLARGHVLSEHEPASGHGLDPSRDRLQLMGHHSPDFTAKRYLSLRVGWLDQARQAALDLDL